MSLCLIPDFTIPSLENPRHDLSGVGSMKVRVEAQTPGTLVDEGAQKVGQDPKLFLAQ